MKECRSIHTCICTHIHMRVCIHTYTHTHGDKHRRARTHTNMHTNREAWRKAGLLGKIEVLNLSPGETMKNLLQGDKTYMIHIDACVNICMIARIVHSCPLAFAACLSVRTLYMSSVLISPHTIYECQYTCKCMKRARVTVLLARSYLHVYMHTCMHTTGRHRKRE